MNNPYIALLLVVTPLFCLNVSTNAQGIVFEDTNWEAVKAKAQKENKPIFVDTYASWCEPCKWMDKNTFSQEEVGTFFSKNYISYKINVENGEGITFAENYHVHSYPTLLFFDANGELVHRIIGAFKADELLEKSVDALNPDKQIYKLQDKFESGNRKSDFLMQYAYAMKSVNEDCDKVVNAYLESQGKAAWVEEKNFEFLEQFVNDYKHEAYRYVAENKTKFVISLGLDRVENYLDAAFKIRLYEIIENASGKAVVKEFHQDVKALIPARVDYFKSRMDFYYNRGDERKDYRFAKKYEKHCKDSKSLNGLARYLLDMHGNSKTHLESALAWVEKAILLEETIYTLETKAMILSALDRKEEALLVAEKQLLLSKEKGEYVEKTEALIEKIKSN